MSVLKWFCVVMFLVVFGQEVWAQTDAQVPKKTTVVGMYGQGWMGVPMPFVTGIMYVPYVSRVGQKHAFGIGPIMGPPPVAKLHPEIVYAGRSAGNRIEDYYLKYKPEKNFGVYGVQLFHRKVSRETSSYSQNIREDRFTYMVHRSVLPNDEGESVVHSLSLMTGWGFNHEIIDQLAIYSLFSFGIRASGSNGSETYYYRSDPFPVYYKLFPLVALQAGVSYQL